MAREGLYTQEDWVESSALRASQSAMLPICAAVLPPLIQGVGSAMCSSPPDEIMAAIGVPHSAKLLKQ